MTHLKYHDNTTSRSKKIHFFTPLVDKPNLENLTFTYRVKINFQVDFVTGYLPIDHVKAVRETKNDTKFLII